MGTIIFVVLRLLNLFDTSRDLVIICFLISLDSIGLPALYRMVRGDS